MSDRVADYDYPLPPERIAQRPLARRDAARLLVDRGGGPPCDRRVADLPDLLEPGDLLVLNETRVLPARLRLRKPSGGRVEVLLLEPARGECGARPGDPRRRGAADGDDRDWWALVRPSRRVAPGTELVAGPGLTVVVGDHTPDGRRAVHLGVAGGGVLEALSRYGEVPLPPYVHEPLDDPERYQTVYGAAPGSVAAPTAGLHLTGEVLAACRARGVEVATVELRVGLDTFRPMTGESVAEHRLHTEWYRVPAATRDACDRARRVVAVGTTVVRALESAARGPAEGRTGLFLRPGEPFLAVDGMLTNFHLPRSTLLVLVAAFVGPRWRELYDVALARGYRFLSFGDAMLLWRRP